MALVVRGAQAARAFAQSPQGKALLAQAALSGIQSLRQRQSVPHPITRASRPSPPRRQPRRPHLGPQLGAMGVCAITNPFCDESKGSRWPDDSAAHSVSVPVRFRTPITVGASGSTAVVFTANAIRSIGTGIVVGNSVTDWSVVTRPGVSLFYSSSGVRVVSGGIKFVSTLAPMSASGSVTVIEVPPNSDSDPGTGSSQPFQDYVGLDLTNQNRSTYLTSALRNDSSIFSLFRPQGPEARSFNSLVDNVDGTPTAVSFNTFDWTSQVVYIQGAPANTTIGFVDYFLNVEVSFDVLSEFSLFARPAPPSNPSLIQVSQALLRSPNVHVGNDSSVDGEFMSRAMGYLKRGALSIANHGINALENAAASYLSGGQYSAGATTVSNGFSIRQISDRP